MKKIGLALFAAAAMVFGLAGCSGDLHDAPAFNLDLADCIGTFDSWSGTPLVKDNASTYHADFTATATEELVSVRCTAGSWATRYCGDNKGVQTEYAVGAAKAEMYYFDGGDPQHCKVTGLTVGNNYRFVFTTNADENPGDTTVYLNVVAR